MPDSQYDVEILNVTKQFGETKAVDDLTLKIERGKFYSFLGPSGCGKTTTLRMIAGFEDPTQGEIRIGGSNVEGLPPYKRNVNTVFQHYALFPHMTVFDNVAYGLKQKKTPTAELGKRTLEALAMVRLTGREKSFPKQMSGGQQQRVALARALVNRPQVLLLDEPLGALDLKLRKQMQLELKTLQTQVGITFIYVTHDQEEALTMSDYIAVMNAGKVLQLDKPEAIYERPASKFVADFIGESNFFSARVKSQEGQRVVVDADGLPNVQAVSELALGNGTQVIVAVRPERILLVREPFEGMPNQFRGRVENLVYTGSTTAYQVRLGEQALFTVRENNVGRADAASDLKVGDQVYAYWTQENARVLTG
ncbi:MAG: ABC transporter ATP-binding protein [Chloroflexota bacterium]|nr:MAG: ABC transporter ATP-binding protein [Chloroflexota bacterium]